MAKLAKNLTVMAQKRYYIDAKSICCPERPVVPRSQHQAQVHPYDADARGLLGLSLL